MSDLWDRRIRRAEHLEKEWPFAAEILRFYRGLTTLQKRHFEEPTPVDDCLYEVLEYVEREGPEVLKSSARSLRPEHPDLIFGHVEEASGRNNPAAQLILQCMLQLAAMRGAIVPPSSPPEEPPQSCRQCASLPIVSVLREDRAAETVRRSLACCRCTAEWEFPRVLCPGCKEERPEKLPRYQAPEIPWIRIEACDSCRSYLKSVDLTKDPDAEPVVDELASTPLDVIAQEKGYEKITPNLAGI